MADAATYARWLVDNADKAGTPEFETVTQAFRAAQKPAEPTLGQTVAASIPGSLAYGVARIPYGALQLGADVGDAISRRLGNEPFVGDMLRDKLRQYDAYREGGNPDIAAEVAQFAGEVIPGLGATKVPQAANWLRRFLSGAERVPAGVVANTARGAATGAFYGASMPTTGTDPVGDRIAPAATGATVGATLNAVSPVAMRVLERFSKSGRQRVAGRVLNEAAGERQPQVLAALEANRNPLTQGTAGEVATGAGSAEFSALQRNMERRLPSEYDALRVGQDAERIAAVRSVGGTADDLAKAKAARAAAANPLYSSAKASDDLVDPRRTVRLIDNILDDKLSNDASGVRQVVENVRESLFEHYPAQRRARDAWDMTRNAIAQQQSRNAKVLPELVQLRQILNRVKNFEIDEFVAAERIKALKGSNQLATDTIKEAQRLLTLPDYVVSQQPRNLINASQSLGRILGMRQADNPVANLARRELSVIKRMLDGQIGKIVPEFKQANQQYAAASRGIDQMEVGQYLENKLVTALGSQGADAPTSATQFASAVRDAPGTIARATGYKRALALSDVLDPQAEQTIRRVGADLARKADFDRLARAGTPNINQQLGDLFGEAAPGMIDHKVTILNALAKATGAKASDLTLRDLARVMMDPAETAKLMRAASEAERRDLAGAFRAIATLAAARSSQATSEQFTEAQR